MFVIDFEDEDFSKVIPNVVERETIVSAIIFFCDYLKLSNQLNRLQFDPYDYINHGPTGTCTTAIKCNKTYYIGFAGKSDTRSITDVITTIAHELIHVKQYLFDDLCSATIKNQEAGDQKIPYRETWWEKEAFGRQEELTIEFVKYIS